MSSEYPVEGGNLPYFISRMTETHFFTTGDDVKVAAQVPEADGSHAHGEVEAYGLQARLGTRR
jgi:hypothetical protein